MAKSTWSTPTRVTCSTTTRRFGASGRRWTSVSGQGKVPPEERTRRVILLDAY